MLNREAADEFNQQPLSEPGLDNVGMNGLQPSTWRFLQPMANTPNQVRMMSSDHTPEAWILTHHSTTTT